MTKEKVREHIQAGEKLFSAARESDNPRELLETSLQEFNLALEAENSTYCLRRKGMILERLGQTEEALSCYQEIVEQDPFDDHAFSKVTEISKQLDRAFKSSVTSEDLTETLKFSLKNFTEDSDTNTTWFGFTDPVLLSEERVVQKIENVEITYSSPKSSQEEVNENRNEIHGKNGTMYITNKRLLFLGERVYKSHTYDMVAREYERKRGQLTRFITRNEPRSVTMHHLGVVFSFKSMSKVEIMNLGRLPILHVFMGKPEDPGSYYHIGISSREGSQEIQNSIEQLRELGLTVETSKMPLFDKETIIITCLVVIILLVALIIIVLLP